jgi:hypothetical protein
MDGTNRAAQALSAWLEGWECAGYRLRLNTQKNKTRSGWAHFAAKLIGGPNEISTTPLISGIMSLGGKGVRPWIECRIYPKVEFSDGRRLDARALGMEKGVIERLAEMIPPGGHLMVDYESGGQEETFAELVLGVLPIATHLGALLFAAGFSGQFKDWYFSEGGHEGPRKLQANKPPDEAAARCSAEQHRRELQDFLKTDLPAGESQAALVARAKRRAAALLAEALA